MYGFRKIVQIEQGGLRLDRDEMEFAHPYFLQGREDLLELIKRKVANPIKPEETKSADAESLQLVLKDVHTIKNRQELLTSQMHGLRKENETLWREVATLRQKHLKQQQIVNKLIQFLASVMGTKRRVGPLKRSYPLMIDGSDHLGTSHPAKYARPIFEGTNAAENNLGYTVDMPEPATSPFDPNSQTQGVLISEILDPTIAGATGVASSPEYVFVEVTSAAGQPGQTYVVQSPRETASPRQPGQTYVVQAPRETASPTVRLAAQMTSPTVQPLPSYVIEAPRDTISPNAVQMQPPPPYSVSAPAGTVRTVNTNVRSAIPSTSVLKPRLPSITQAPPNTGQVYQMKNSMQPRSGVAISRVENPVLLTQPRSLNPTPAQRSNAYNKVAAGTSRSNTLSDVSHSTMPSSVKVKVEPGLDLESLLMSTSAEPSPSSSFSTSQVPTTAVSSAVSVVDPKTSSFNRSSYDIELENMAQELENVQNTLLTGGNYNLDLSTLLELFNPEMPLPATSEHLLNFEDNLTGNELIQYSGQEDFDSIFDLGGLENMAEDNMDQPLDTPQVPQPEDNMSYAGPFKTGVPKMEEVD